MSSSITEALRLVIDGESRGAQGALGDVIGATKEWEDSSRESAENVEASMSSAFDGVKSGVQKILQGDVIGGLADLKDAGGEAAEALQDAFSDAFEGISDAFSDIVAGDFSEGLSGMGDAVDEFLSDPAVIAGGVATGAALAAGIYKGFKKGLEAYSEIAGDLGLIKGLTGLQDEDLTGLYGQFRMTGTEVDAAATSIGRFSRVLEDARAGGDSLQVFKDLGIDVYTANGELREGNDVLAETRDAISQMDDSYARNAVSQQLFGKGFQALRKWLSASQKDIDQYSQVVADSGFEYDASEYSQLVKDQREMSLRWELMWAEVGDDLIPLLQDSLIPAIRDVTTQLEKIPNLSSGIGPALSAGFAPLKDAAGLLGSITGLIGSIKDVDLSGVARSLWEGFQYYLDLMLDTFGGLPRWIQRLLEVGGGGEEAALPAAQNIAAATPAQATTSAQSVQWVFGGVIPGLANEGLVKHTPGGTIVRVSEIEDEVVMKASRLRGNQGRGDITINVNGANKSPRQIALEVKQILMDDLALTGAMSRG